MTGEVLIDLGIDRDEYEAEFDRAPRPIRWREALRRYKRWVGAGLVALALVALPVAEPVSAPLVLRFTVPSLPIPDYANDPERMYALTSDGGVLVVRAYGFSDGRVRWEARVPDAGRFDPRGVIVRQLEGVLGVTTFSGRPATDSGDFTAFFEPATGRPLWQTDAEVRTPLGDGRLMLVRGSSVADGNFERYVEERQVVDARTGRVLSSTTVRGDQLLHSAWDWNSSPPTREVTILPDGRMEVRRLGSGELIASAFFGVPGRVVRPWIIGDLVVVYTDSTTLAGAIELRAYSLPALDVRWTRPIEVTDQFPVVCGPWLCLAAEHSVEAVDPATGAQRWIRTGWDLLGLLTEGWGGQVLMTGSSQLLVDPREPRPIVDLGHLNIEGVSDNPDTLLVSHGPNETGTARLGILRPGYPAVRWLGVVTRTQPCGLSGFHLICPTAAGLQVWRLRR